MSKVKVAMLEPNKHGIEGWKESYKEIFEKIGYEIEYVEVDTSASDVFSMFNFKAIDVFISDLSLGDTSSYDGLRVVSKVKKHFPNILVLAHSMEDLTLVQAASCIPSFDLFVSKIQLNDQDYKDYLREKISEKLTRNIQLKEICCKFNNTKNLDDSQTCLLQLEDILKNITFTTHRNDPKTAITKVVLEPLYGGFSSSDVFRMEAYTDEGLKCINAVLKLSPIEIYQQEIDNYLNYVKWYLPYNIRPELIASCQSFDYGAICYSFVYNDEIPFRPLTHDLARQRFERLDLVIESIFSPQNKRWYSNENIENEEGLTGYYWNKWFQGREFDDRAIRRVVGREGQCHDNELEIDEIKFPRPQSFLLGLTRKEYISSICHGDLNGNNILISDDSSISLIDFNRIGRGHVFDDFVTFEGAIRLNARLAIGFSELMTYENRLNKLTFKGENNPDSLESDEILIIGGRRPVSEAITKIRRYSEYHRHGESIYNYYYALALYCLRLTRLKNLEDWQLEQLSACLLQCELMLLELGD